MRSAFLVALFAVLAVPAQAQTNDPRWEPWVGCWTLAVDDVSDGQSQDPSPRRAATANALRDNAPQVCVSPASGGAQFITTVAGQSAIEQTIIADAARRAVSDDECSGMQRAEWSKNGLRLFSSAEINCKGDQGLRRVSGLALIAPNGDWVDIQTVAVGERETVRVKRYHRVADSQQRPQRPNVARSAFTLDEVIEASAKVSPAAVEAALVESGGGFNLTARKLIELDNAGVPDRVTDLIVALSYPEKFSVQRVPQATPGGQVTYVRDPFFYYDYYGFYGSPYYYEPFGYRGYAIYGPIYVVDGGGGGGGGGGSASGRGRIVNGQGYTRIEPRVNPLGGSDSGVAQTASSGRVGSGSSPSSGGSDSSSSGSSSSGSSSGSSGGGSASPGGYSSGSSSGGSSGGDTGRTAIPR